MLVKLGSVVFVTLAYYIYLTASQEDVSSVLRCYYCTEKTPEECTPVKSGGCINDWQCIQFAGKLNGEDFYYRGCYPVGSEESSCKMVADKELKEIKECSVCNKSLCNDKIFQKKVEPPTGSAGGP